MDEPRKEPNDSLDIDESKAASKPQPAETKATSPDPAPQSSTPDALTPSPEPEQPRQRKRRPLTPAELSKRYLFEGCIVFVFFLWFFYDGWFNPEIKAKAFNKGVALLLGYWFCHCIFFTIKYRRIARQQPDPMNGSSRPPSSPPPP